LYSVTVNRSGGYPGGVTLAATGAPASASATFSPNPSTGAQSTLQLALPTSTRSGSYTIQITGTAANQSPQGTTVQLVVTTKGKPFAISGAPTEPLYPGARPLPIDLVLTNPNNQSIQITNLTVSVSATSAGSACPASNYAVHQYSGSYPISIGKGASVHLASVPGVTASQLPTVQLINDPTHVQDRCAQTTVFLSYSGSGNG
jgi:hypothetical protein